MASACNCGIDQGHAVGEHDAACPMSLARAVGWRKATGYAFASAIKLWRERDGEGDPSLEHLREWVPYYLAQQWDHKMPPGGLFS